MINNKIKVQIVLCVSGCAYFSIFEMSKGGAGEGKRQVVGFGEGGHGSLLWPELALTAPVLKGDSGGAGGGEGSPVHTVLLT